MAIRLHLLSGILLTALLGCSTGEQLAVEDSGARDANAGIDYSIVYLLHGDADYLYHSEGIPLQADEEVLKKARRAGESAERGEVFIFHQRPEQKVFWLFSKKDRVMYHYRNGRLVNRIRYSPETNNVFGSESRLYKTYSRAPDSGKPLKRVLLFYGHEIPSADRNGYYRSRPDVRFGSSAFAEGIASFGGNVSGHGNAAGADHTPGSSTASDGTSDSSNVPGKRHGSDSPSLDLSVPFDLIVLSTCNNGTPHMMNLLNNKARYVLASPQNLHLSHIDSDSLAALERNPGISTADLAGKIADQTLERMSESIHTGVTLTLYDMEAMEGYVSDLAGRVAEQRSADESNQTGTDNVDCRRLLSGGPLENAGVTVWFNPPAFGPKSGIENHSGWGCMDVSDTNKDPKTMNRDQSQQKMRVLFDTDTNNEIDDQHALAYLLFNGDSFAVEGITVNSTKEPSVDMDYKEAERVLKLCKADGKVPLKKGADGIFRDIKDQVDQPDFDGAPAVNFIIEQAMAEKEGELILLAVGKLTNIALALKKEPAVASNARLVWLGSNYPGPGEHNLNADTTALNYVLNSQIPFEIATVRYGQPSGTSAVSVTKEQILTKMPGKGPQIAEPVEGRHGGSFTNFGDYSANLFENYPMEGDPPSRPLYDMAAVAIVKNPGWAESKQVPAPVLVDGEWVDRPENERTITVWETFHVDAILSDFFKSMRNPILID